MNENMYMIYNIDGTKLIICADDVAIKDNIATFSKIIDGFSEPVAIFNMNNITGFNVLKTV